MLVLMTVAMLLAVFVLPSSLNLPQSNPSTVLEYAPVPPEDDNPPPPADGNLSTLALGSSSTLAAPVAPPLPPVTEGVGARPNQKRCVGNPPRQTEDPSSPPCVPFFEGDNFGETYQGVTKDEIRVLVYYDEAVYGLTGRQDTSYDAGTYVDIDRAPKPSCPPDNGRLQPDPEDCDHSLIRMLRAFSRYFNSRFQTYGRHVHYWAYFANSASAAGRSGDAVANWERLKPFAVIDAAIFNGFNEDYETAMAQTGVLSFSSQLPGTPNEFYRRVAPKAWGFWPDVEHAEDMYASYICQKVKPHPVSRYGNPSGVGAPNGSPRKFGIYYPTDPAFPGISLFTDLLLNDLRRCGVTPVEATYPKQGYAVDGGDTGTEAAQAAARFRQEGVTTVMYIGTEGRLTAAMDAVRYYPEIVVAGNLDNDNNYIGQVSNQNVWQNAWGVTYHTRINRLEDAPGYRAFREGDPNSPPGDSAGIHAREEYADHFMLFQAIQVAGPKLTPESVDKGFHAIPERPGVDSFTPAFFFDPNDYTSVKDATEIWWDPQGRSRGGGTPSNRPGCWRLVREGKRYLAGSWAGGDDVFANPSDPCNGYDGGIKLRTAG